MAIQDRNIEQYIPQKILSAASFQPGQIEQREITIGGRRVPHVETLDFPRSDPWSRFMRRGIRTALDEGLFRGQRVTEFGIGDGRNVREVAGQVRRIEGVDVDEWRLKAAAVNLDSERSQNGVSFRLWLGSAVDYPRFFSEQRGRQLDGVVIACLPQSPEGINHADVYDTTETSGSKVWDKAGLTLNALVLTELRGVANRELRMMMIISDRVPDNIREDMIEKTGWTVEQKKKTEQPIQQDPDTGISWVKSIDDGRRFFLRTGEEYQPISAKEAEDRRQESLRADNPREVLNVHHHLTIYQIRTNGTD